MKPPRIPPMATDIVQTAVCAFDGAVFSRLAVCPVCGGQVQGYDMRQKRYAVIREGDNRRTVTVKVKRFICRKCRALINADEPFYPGTRTGSLVVDLYFTLSSTMPGSRAARVIDAMDIVVDRTTWRNYCRKDYPLIPSADVFGLCLPVSLINLSALAAKIPDGYRCGGDELLTACRYPSIYAHDNARRKKE
jgi:hypothetical protein